MRLLDEMGKRESDSHTRRPGLYANGKYDSLKLTNLHLRTYAFILYEMNSKYKFVIILSDNSNVSTAANLSLALCCAYSLHRRQSERSKSK